MIIESNLKIHRNAASNKHILSCDVLKLRDTTDIWKQYR
jgi:hypothetical protein